MEVLAPGMHEEMCIFTSQQYMGSEVNISCKWKIYVLFPSMVVYTCTCNTTLLCAMSKYHYMCKHIQAIYTYNCCKDIDQTFRFFL